MESKTDHTITVADTIPAAKFHLDTLQHNTITEPHGAGHKSTRRLIHPTHAKFQHNQHENLHLNWTARNHRKGRQNIEIHAPKAEHDKRKLNDKIRTKVPSWKHLIQPMNISWWVAIFFTVGSIVWCVNGFFIFLPYANPQLENYFDAEIWTAFAGGTIFQFGAILALIEALHSQALKVDFDFKPQKRRLYHLYKLKFNIRDLGTLSAIAQLIGATIFEISVITGVVPGAIEDALSGVAIGLYWTPQVVGGCGFIISSLLIMYETQDKWWKFINLKAIGWHIGFWNLVGAVGFTLCGALGYSSQINYGTAYQSALSTFWGSWGFLIGSVIQLYESIDRNPTSHVIKEEQAKHVETIANTNEPAVA
jgi:preprotein translocase subunit Sss1